MIKKARYSDNRPVVVYNILNQEKIGVFINPITAARYLYPNRDVSRGTSSVSACLRDKTRARNTFLDFPVCFRYGVEGELKGLKFVIFDGYPVPNQRQMEGFTSNRVSMGNESRLINYKQIRLKQ